MNCGFGIRKSILMDYVPKGSRGTWNSLDSVTRFGWSGSAVIGGYFVDSHGYGGTFFITAAIQFLAWSLYWVLLPLVPSQLPQSKNTNLSEPLLNSDVKEEEK